MPRVASRPKAVRSWPDRVPQPNRTLGWEALAWTADYLQQPDGPAAGSPWEFTDEQTRIVLRWYAVDAQGKFLHRRGVLRRMKGWGKDPFLAAIAAIELCGPCRFAGWNAHRMPVGVAHPAAWIQVAAVSRDQTRNTMTLFPGLFSAKAVDEYGLDLGKEIIHSRRSGRIEAVTSSPRSLEGGRPSLVIANETHHWLSSNDGLEMAQAIRRNLGKSRDGSARAMEITNAHLPGEGSAAELTYEAWRQSSGKVDGVYYDSVEAPPIADLSDLAAVRAGLVCARGDSTWVDIDRVLEEIADPVTPESLARRFYLNQVFEVAAEDWLPAGAWMARATKETIPDGTEIVLGVDGSFNNDSTGVVACTLGDDPHLEVVGCWERPETDRADWTVPVLDVEETIKAACKRWKVRSVAFDPWRWGHSMQVLIEEGIPVEEFPQSPQRMVPATQLFFEGVVNESLTHSGDGRLARHVGNCVIREDSRGRRIRKETKWSPRKIDLAVAAVMALATAQAFKGLPSAARLWLEGMVDDAEPSEATPQQPEPAESPPVPVMSNQTKGLMDLLRTMPRR